MPLYNAADVAQGHAAMSMSDACAKTMETMAADAKSLGSIVGEMLTFQTLVPIAAIIGLGSISQDDMDPYLPVIRFAYFLTQCSFLCMWCYILLEAGKNEEPGKLDLGEYSKREAQYKKVPKGSHKIMTISQYDASECWPKLRGVGIGTLMVVGVHLQWGHTIPLVMSTVMAWIELPSQQLVKLYLLGYTEKDDAELKRPWKQETMFPKLAEAMEKQNQAQSDKRTAKRQPPGCSSKETVHVNAKKSKKK